MKYPYDCGYHGTFDIESPMKEGPPQQVFCPECGLIAQRIYTVSREIWNVEGSSRDYFSENMGRGQPMDKKEWLNKRWSEHYNEPPPPPDSIGTYDGVPRKGQVIRKKK